MAKEPNYHPTRRGSVLLHSAKTADLISAEALQHVVLPKSKKARQNDKVERREDAIGDQMTAILNSHPDFSYDTTRSNASSNSSADNVQNQGFTLSPLLSWRNWVFLTRQSRRIRSLRLSTLFLSVVGFCCEQCPSRQKCFGLFTSSLLLFFTALALGLSAITLSGHVATMLLGREAFLVLIQLLLILIDWGEFEKMCPQFLRGCVRQLSNFARLVDRFVLVGKRFSGREWNTDDFEFTDPLIAQSRHTDLWSLPPPCNQGVGQSLCLDTRYMARDEWSHETSQHVVAINFAYAMMREEHARKRARRSTVFHQPRRPLPAYVPPPQINDSLDGNVSLGAKDKVQSSSLHAKLHEEHVFGEPSNSSAEGIELVHEEDGSIPERLEDATWAELLVERENDTADGSPTSPLDEKSDHGSMASSVGSCSSAAAADMNWVDISAKIGRRVLNSAHLQRVVASQETAERLKNITEQFVVNPRGGDGASRKQLYNSVSVGTTRSPGDFTNGCPKSVAKVPHTLPRSPCRPVHSMWTSAAAAASNSDDENSGGSTGEVEPNETTTALHGVSPSTPPKLIRTRQFSESSPRRRGQLDSVSPLRDVGGSVQRQKQTPTREHHLGSRVDCDEFSTCKLRYPASSTNHVDLEHGAILFEDGKFGNGARDLTNKARCWSQSYGYSLGGRKLYKREPLLPGVKVAAPIFPFQPGRPTRRKVGHSNYQMATVVSSTRIWIDKSTAPITLFSDTSGAPTNCLSVTCKIDKSFLRNGDFTEVTFRVMDEWSSRYMPKHSKVPIGSCVATLFGVGVVVGWRVEDDCHVVRSLWQRRGPGAAHAYLSRDAIQCILEAAIGFDVATKLGSAKVLAYVDAGANFKNGRYIIKLQGDGVYKNCVVALKRDDVYSCYGAQFIPVIEHIKEACHYQIMLDNYKALVRQQKFTDEESRKGDDHVWKFWSENLDILWQSFLKATSEDREFDEGVDSFMGSIIDFLERLEGPPSSNNRKDDSCDVSISSLQGGEDLSRMIRSHVGEQSSECIEEEHVAGFWILDDILGGVLQTNKEANDTEKRKQNSKPDDPPPAVDHLDNSNSYKRAFAVIRTLMKTVSLARAASVGKPQFRLALTICREFLMFARTLIKVQQKNVSQESLRVWKSALKDIVSTFGPIKDRMEKIGRGIKKRMEQQGRKSKIKVLRFADSILLDEPFLSAACQGEWEQCLLRIESCMVKAKIIDEASSGHYRKTARFLYEHLVLFSSKEGSAAARNNEKLAHLAKLVQFFASPRRSFLKVLRSDNVLEILERILIRVFCREEVASRTLTIHASHFKSLRHLRILKDLSVAGRLWIPLLDAADEEFSYVVSRMPENAKEFMCPLSSIFSLCVAQFHKISAGNMTTDWLDFLMEEDAVRIIHDIDMKLILALSSFSRDVKEMIEVLPYYPSIDDDILNLIDEVKIDMFLKEASDAIDDADKLAEFIREKASIVVDRFLAYLPKLSIPVERRDLGDGWVLTCHGHDGGDLTLSDVKIKRENLVCQILGDDLFVVVDAIDDTDKSIAASVGSITSDGACLEDTVEHVEESILDHIRQMILQAQRHGSWTVGIGGVGQPPTDQYLHSVLRGLPITSVLNCAIELWRNLEIDDDELLEIAIRDVSYQIQLHKEMEDQAKEERSDCQPHDLCTSKSSQTAPHSSASKSGSFEDMRNRFNPHQDPTCFFLEMKNLTLHLEQFRFRIEKNEKRTVFDPVFEGCGTVTIEDVCILLRVECARERIRNAGLDLLVPVLLLRDLEVDIRTVKMKVQDTGADWLLNKAVKGFEEQITHVVATNLKEQVQKQTKSALAQLNSYFSVHPDILLGILGIEIDDLEERPVWL